MAYQNDNGGGGGQFPQREMNDVSDLGITCVECNVKIDKLPFQPNKKEDGTFGKIYCAECNRKRPPRQNFRPRGNFGGQRNQY